MLSNDEERFIIESNRIEGIHREALISEKQAFVDFMKHKEISVDDVATFVMTIEPGALLRSCVGMNVRIGNYFFRAGGPDVKNILSVLLHDINEQYLTPWEAHVKYEKLHPFMDGNGRSGRMIWWWMMSRTIRYKSWKEIGFLHSFYYQTLENSK
jgi:hypothetical protein